MPGHKNAATCEGYGLSERAGCLVRQETLLLINSL